MKKQQIVHKKDLRRQTNGEIVSDLYRTLLLSAMNDAGVSTVCLLLTDPRDEPHRLYDHKYYKHVVVKNGEVTNQPLCDDELCLQVPLHRSRLCDHPEQIAPSHTP